MKSITLDRLTILNFKGGQGTYHFKNTTTSVYGANGCGKTRLADAFTWLLFGKNTKGQTNFEIKPLDINNNPINKVPVEVSADIYVDNNRVTLSKLYEENWVRPRGAEKEVLKGHNVTYKIDDVPVSEKEYNSKIGQICEEKTFLLLTNPQAFTSLHWEAQREFLITMAKLPAPQVIFVGNNEMLDLLERMSGKSEDEYRALVGAKIKKCKEELKTIEPALNEQRRMLPEEVDYTALEKEYEESEANVKELSAKLISIDEESKEITKRAVEASKKITNLKLCMENLIAEDKKSTMSNYYKEVEEWQANTSKLRKYILQKKEIDDTLTKLSAEVTRIEEAKQKLKENWYEIDATRLVFNDEEFSCKHCGSPYSPEKAIEIRELAQVEFNSRKAKTLKDITAEGVEHNKRLDIIAKEVEIATSQRNVLNNKIEELKKLCNELEPIPPIYEYHPSPEYVSLQERVSNLEKEAKIAAENESDYNVKSELSIELHHAIEKTKQLFEKLSERNQKNRILKRINELSESEKALSAELAKHEQEEYLVNRLSKEIIETAEAKVSAMFQIVKFKLFTSQINGGEAPTCQAMVNGVPFQGLNTAMQINAGLDIIRALQKHIGISAPIFIDNRESTTSIPELDCQVISLFVSPEHTNLYILN